MIPAQALGVALLLMLWEQRRSLRNERLLRRRGAVEPSNDVYTAMAWVYPAAFIGMAIEGWLRGGGGAAFEAGLLVFAAAKALKYWAVVSLGERWTFRVLVPPGGVRVGTGPYRWLRHPNYVAVVGELLGFAILLGAPAVGIPAIAVFWRLIWQRIRVEEAALRGT